MKKKIYETPEVEMLEISVEQGFAASSAIDNPDEVDESSDYWS